MNPDAVERMIDEVGVAEASRRLNVAGVLFTYRCSIACRHCLFGCAGGRPDVAMTPRQCADALALLRETNRVAHIAGGEIMLYWPAVAEGVRIAHAEGNPPHFIETNCSFAVNDDLVRERLSFLQAHGMRGVYASADGFHQEFVSPERFLRVRRIAIELFGQRNFCGSGAPDVEILALAELSRDEERLRSCARRSRMAMVGTAQRELARFMDSYAPEDPALPAIDWKPRPPGVGCADQFRAESLSELHIDPYGNIQTNCGMLLGHISRVRPAEVLASGPEKVNRFIETVCARGPFGLADLARREYGYTPPSRVTQWCDLCCHVRRFLHPFHPEAFGPTEVYT